MFEISIGTVAIKLLWSFVATGVIGTFFLWPVGDKPTSTEQKVCFVVATVFAIAFIFELIVFTG